MVEQDRDIKSIAMHTHTSMQTLLEKQHKQNERLDALGSMNEDEKKALEKREHIIANMVIKQEKKEQENKMNIFQMADSLESMDKNIKERLGKIEKILATSSHHDAPKRQASENFDFLKKHFSKEENI